MVDYDIWWTMIYGGLRYMVDYDMCWTKLYDIQYGMWRLPVTRLPSKVE